MRRTVVFLAIAPIFILLPGLVLGFAQKRVWNKIEAIKQLPFCALKVMTLESQFGREVHILMEPDEVTESNLLLLFRVVSEKNPEPLELETFVSTDIQQLRSLVTNMNTSATLSEEDSEKTGSDVISTSSQRKAEKKWAYYKRTNQVELFRFNATFPRPGMKTIVLRGKE
jgi:hypothetical protein